jgi:putative peptidoglycan lipid II flippase
MKQESFLHSIGTAVLWKGLDRVAGFAKHVIIAAAIGLSAQLDVFYMVVALLGVLVFSWASMIDVVAVPNMLNAWQKGRRDEFKQIASGLFSLVLAASALLALILYLGKDLVAQIAIGFEAERRQLLADAIIWLLPVILLYIPLRLMGAVLRAIRQFSTFYQAEFLTALTVLVCVAMFREDRYVLLWSFSVGVSSAFLFLLHKSRHFIFPLGNPFSNAVRQSLQLAPSLLVLQGAHFIFIFTDRLFVSFLPTGAVAALAFAMTLVSLLPGVISLSGSFITIIAEQDSGEGRGKRLNALLSIVIFVALGSTCFLLLAGPTMVQVLLERGMFSAADTQLVATGILAYSWIVLPLFLIGPLDQIFQVERRIGFMVRRTALGLATNIVLSAWFLFGLGWGLIGVALATSISYWVILTAGLHSLKGIGYQIEWVRHLKWAGWISIFLAPIFFLSSFMPVSITHGLPNLLMNVCAVLSVLLIAGLTYSGEESVFVRKTLYRCLPKALKS